MGTNFYARIIPKEEDIKRVQQAVGRYLSGHTLSIDEDIITDNIEKIHLGKRSCGWQFLWQDNPKYYQANLESIKKFLGREDVIIYDEYGDRYSVEELFENEIGYCLHNDNDKYLNGRQYAEKYNEDFRDFGEWITDDGLRFVKGDFS